MCSATGSNQSAYGSDKQVSFAGSLAQGMGGSSSGAAASVLGSTMVSSNGTVLASWNPPRVGQGWRGPSNSWNPGGIERPTPRPN